jgi:hypothetical protein
MSEYRIRSTGEVKTQGQIRSMHPNVSLPKVWNANVNETLGIDPVLASSSPDPSGDYKVVVRNGVEQDANGNWVEAWAVAPQFPEYTNEEGVVVTEAEQIAAYEARMAAERRSKHRCTARQARLALAASGSLEAIEAAVAAQGGAAAIEWEYANEIERSSPLIAGMAASLGWSEEDLDALFDLAVTL